MTKKIILAKKVRAKNQDVADELRLRYADQGMSVLNFIGSPGSGKTALLEAMAPHFQGSAAVIEGDLETDKDRARIEKSGLDAYQINTLGACHLDADMVRDAMDALGESAIRYLFIENVGNLVCPTSFDLGERAKIVVISVTEGDDKPAKYPGAIRNASALIITKTDLLPYVDCDVDTMIKDSRTIHPDLPCFQVSIKTGDGVSEVAEWIIANADRL